MLRSASIHLRSKEPRHQTPVQSKKTLWRCSGESKLHSNYLVATLLALRIGLNFRVVCPFFVVHPQRVQKVWDDPLNTQVVQLSVHVGQFKLQQQLCFCCEDVGPSLQTTAYCSAVLCVGLKSSEARDWRGVFLMASVTIVCRWCCRTTTAGETLRLPALKSCLMLPGDGQLEQQVGSAEDCWTSFIQSRLFLLLVFCVRFKWTF